ncbi:MarR family winged helix-turn-helix transcriptional regulator [Periweissella fabalis]|uniref:Winged helix-turn-helix transcriptional regulator n=1 Tax=Periweissella fabalis TaxID=1070421 RepID=A0A7X6S2M3_9LACO|nr:MarR family winged helix-turn-helix transcriptional regulator [Periweissella fabalis]MCM0598548.1 winged helix-turn-helix transcriptional regulator [Periweissella fabalis]NKZ24170.1 winged helix-turn-helix transcriptional regulator [Periweissella fabalis]
MMNELADLNAKLVKIFNDVRWVEERNLSQSNFADLSLRDMHTIEAISLDENQTVSQVAHTMCLSPGSMTKIIDKLVALLYVKRMPSKIDRRITHLGLTEKGQQLFLEHLHFHQAMVQALTREMSDREIDALIQGIINVQKFLNRK